MMLSEVITMHQGKNEKVRQYFPVRYHCIFIKNIILVIAQII